MTNKETHVKIESLRGKVEISFGTLFTTRQMGIIERRIDIVTNIGKGDIFYSSNVFKDKKGRQCFCVQGGTAESRNFGKLVGRVPFAEAIRMAKRGYKITGDTLTQKDIADYRKQYKRGKRTLTLKK